MTNNCKKKGCSNETLNGSKYCNYHQSKKESKNKIMVSGVSVLASCVGIIFTKKIGKK